MINLWEILKMVPLQDFQSTKSSYAQVILVELCGSFTSTVNLSWHRWLLCIALGLFRC